MRRDIVKRQCSAFTEHEEAVRSLSSIYVAIIIAVILIGFNLLVAFHDRAIGVLAFISEVPAVWILGNLLCAWLVVLLIVAFKRWRRDARNELEVGTVVSNISPDVLLVVSPQRTIRMCTEAVRRIFGYDPGEVIGRKTELLYGDRRKNPEQPHEIFDVLQRGGFHYGLASGKRSDGSKFPLEIITAELTGRGGAVLLIRDISERVEMELQQRELEARAKRAERLESLGLLAAGIAHDFNNVLTLIQGHAELLLYRDLVAGEAKEGVDGIKRACTRAGDLCQNLMSFAGRRSAEPDRADFAAIINETVDLVEPRLQGRLMMDVNVQPDLPAVYGDVSQFKQVVMNVIGNAIDAMDHDSGTHIAVTVQASRLDEALLSDAIIAPDCADRLYVQLCVTDDGCGMDEVTRLKVCEPFYSTKEKGHGMGMAAVSGIVRSHKGGIAIHSVAGQGTRVTIFLPAGRDGDA